MAYFYYKLNDSSLKVGSLASVDNPRDIAQPLGYSNIQTSNDYYFAGTLSTQQSTSGTFPGYTDESSTTDAVTSSIYYGSAYTRSSSSSSPYSTNILDSFNNASADATVFTMNPDDVIYFCDKNGNSLFSVTLLYPGTLATGYNTYFKWQYLKSGLSGVWYPNISPYNSASVQTCSVFFGISQNVITGFAYKTSNELSGMCSLSAASLVYSVDYTSSPFYKTLTDPDAIVSASGSDDGNSTGASSSGFGDYSFSNVDIDDSDDVPSASSSLMAGFVNFYYVTTGEIASLGAFLWSNDFFDNIAKTFSNPMDCIISLSSFPLASSSLSLGSSESVRVGNTTATSTGTRLSSEFVTIDCGSVSVPEVWGSYLDYAQTKLYIYIPYLGIEELPLCECMGGTVACVLRINLLTGALVACVTLTSGTYVTGSARVQPIYFSTTCKSDIPVSGATTGALAGAFQLLGGAVSSVAGIATGVAPLAISGLASAAQGVATMQSQNSQISGAVGAAGGQMAHKIPFLIFDRPVQSVPANLASVAGYQSNSGTTLSRCSGFVICDTINLDGLALTRSELEEVEQICTTGVYIS